MKRRVYIVGAGPGDPELLTLKAHRVLQQADAVLYDRLMNPEILKLTPPRCERIYVGKTEGNHSVPQEEIHEELYRLSQQFATVVRLKGGDPFVFGRGGEELLFLRERGVVAEVIPGITSAISVPAHFEIPVTHRNVAQSFTVVTGHGAQEEILPQQWQQLVGSDTLVFLMGVKNRVAIARSLVEGGLEPTTPVAFLEHGFSEEERKIVTTLKTLLSEDAPEIRSPAIMVVGHVVHALDVNPK